MITLFIILGMIVAYLGIGGSLAWVTAPTLARYYDAKVRSFTAMYGPNSALVREAKTGASFYANMFLFFWPITGPIYFASIGLQARRDNNTPSVLEKRVREQKDRIKELERDLDIL